MKTEESERFVREVRRISPAGVKRDEPMSRHTTIGIGGPAKVFVVPRSSREVIELVNLARRRNFDYLVIGKGSNLLVRDGGYRGMVIKIAGNLSRINISKRAVHAEAGVSLSLLARKVTRTGRAGLEFALGIPGTVGGAVRMNAGAYGSSISQVLSRLKLVDEDGRLNAFEGEDINFEYRKSGLPLNAIVLSATFRCPPGGVDREIVKMSARRKKTQPLMQKSFGSTFMNPSGGFAGRYIEACGLKGVRRGGAMISRKHANFIVNVGDNTSAGDVEALINLARREVRKKFGVTLKPEVIIVGD